MSGPPSVRFWRVEDPNLRGRIRSDLRKVGLADEVQGDAGSGESLLFFERPDEGLAELIFELASERGQRVLAVCVSPERVGQDAMWHLLHAGASDVLWMDSPQEAARCIAARIERWREVDALVRLPETEGIIGRSRAWKRLIRQVVEVARYTRAAVLLLGESGTGKELVARLVHQLDPRASERELAVVDCTTIVPELSGSEFFGHERGAFTGAVSARDGAFAAADGGVLFLDEVGDLPAALQSQLLRVIQEGSYKRVGSDVWRHSRFRLVSATHRDLPTAVAEERFRHDLYHRIAGWVFRIPPLRDRPEDILPLARHFLQFDEEGSKLDFDPGVAAYLQARSYPGNVRELRQLVARIRGRHVGPGPVTAGDLPEDERPTAEPMFGSWKGARLEEVVGEAIGRGAGLREISQAAADAAAHVALRREKGNVHAAAQVLQVSDRALQFRRAAWRETEADASA